MNQPRTQALRWHGAAQVVVELVLPLGIYYGLRAADVSACRAMLVSAAVIIPVFAYRAIRQRRLDTVALFTLMAIGVGTAMSLLTGDPRTLLLRDSWIFGGLGLWVLATLFTQRPFIRSAARTIVTVKLGEDGYREWDARWDDDHRFRRDLRILTAVWGSVFAMDAAVRVMIAYTLPVDLVPLISTLQWVVVLGALIGFHTFYVSKHGLKV